MLHRVRINFCEGVILLKEELWFSFHQFYSISLFWLQRKSSQQRYYCLHTGLVEVPAWHTRTHTETHTHTNKQTSKTTVRRSSQLNTLIKSSKGKNWHLVRHLMSSSAAWLEVPITQSVRYSTILFLQTVQEDKSMSKTFQQGEKGLFKEQQRKIVFQHEDT